MKEITDTDILGSELGHPVKAQTGASAACLLPEVGSGIWLGGCLWDVFLWGFSRHSQLGGEPRQTQNSPEGLDISYDLGQASGSPRRKWNALLRRWPCGKWMDGWMGSILCLHVWSFCVILDQNPNQKPKKITLCASIWDWRFFMRSFISEAVISPVNK